MLELRFTAKFKKDYKRVKRQGKDRSKLERTLETLVREEALPDAMRDHSLGGHIAVTASATSSLTGCSSIAWMKRGLCSLLRGREAIANCWVYESMESIPPMPQLLPFLSECAVQ